MFRDLRADEIEVRVAKVTNKGVSLLLYKDARVDQNILDETVGPYNWMRSHTRDNANCTVSIWDVEKGQWISKEDTGVESFTEKEKGLASDSFKRACFNWGIGRELYTAPFVWVDAKDLAKHEQKDGKWKCGDPFEVESIAIKDKRITELSIKNLKTKAIVFSFGNSKQTKQEPPKQEAPKQETPQQPLTPREMLIARLNELDIPIKKYAKEHGITAGVPDEVFLNCLKELENA
jgi:hypothetical protein